MGFNSGFKGLSCPLNVVPQCGALDISPSVCLTAYEGTIFIPLSQAQYLSTDRPTVLGVIKSEK